MAAVDIIIPVFNAPEALGRCVDSVLRHSGPDERVLLIDDASTDPGIAALFHSLSALEDTRLVLMRNDRNLGFTQTVNRGMRFSDRDVVVLNSDTAVSAGWLEKLKRCALSSADIGTVTPFSNNADMCSFPEIMADNPVPENLELVNRALEQTAVPEYPDIPTAIGFCMYVKRRVLDTIGLLDESGFDRGYGEDNDLSLRAVKAGFRNVLCDDTFVAHWGNRSFGDEKRILSRRHMERLERKYPQYLADCRQFLARDPLKAIRRNAQARLQMLGGADKTAVLHIMHGRAGGSEHYVRCLAAMTERNFLHYILIALDKEWWVQGFRDGEWIELYRFEIGNLQQLSSLLEDICVWLGIQVCHVHQISGCREGLLAALPRAGIPFGLNVHDLYLACPTINLLDAQGWYCGTVTDAQACQRCLDEQPAFRGNDIRSWRKRHAELVAQAAFVVAPSHWARSAFEAYFPGTVTEVAPNPYLLEAQTASTEERPPRARSADNHIRVGVLGAIGPVKGARYLERLVDRTRQRGLPLRWIVIGYTDRRYERYHSRDGVLTVHGHYKTSDLPALIRRYAPRLMVFPSAGPETFCYTLSECWASGVPPLVAPLGALKERVEETGAGWVASVWQDADAFLDEILSLTASSQEKAYRQVLTSVERAADTDQRALVECIKLNYLKHGVSPRPAAADARQRKLFSEAAVYARASGQARDIETSLGNRLLTLLLRTGVRFRYTRCGEWIERRIPARWHYRLRKLLIYGD